MEKLTDKQIEVLDTLKKYLAKHGYPPTVRELGEILGLSSPATTHFHLDKLEKKGYIKKGKEKNRCIELLVPNEFLEKDDKVVTIPLIGTITAGSPIEAIENPDEFLSIPEEIVPKKSEVFALTVEGTSMINKGIRDKDLVIIKRCQDAQNGEIVAAMTSENEVTLKTFYKEKNHIRLQPENDTMSPIILNNVTILGKAVGLYRKF